MQLSRARALSYASFFAFSGVVAFLAPLFSPTLERQLKTDRNNLEWNRGVMFQLFHAVALLALFIMEVDEKSMVARTLILAISEMMAVGTLFVVPCLYCSAVYDDKKDGDEFTNETTNTQVQPNKRTISAYDVTKETTSNTSKVQSHLKAIYAFALSYGSVFVLTSWFLLGCYAMTFG